MKKFPYLYIILILIWVALVIYFALSGYTEQGVIYVTLPLLMLSFFPFILMLLAINTIIEKQREFFTDSIKNQQTEIDNIKNQMSSLVGILKEMEGSRTKEIETYKDLFNSIQKQLDVVQIQIGVIMKTKASKNN